MEKKLVFHLKIEAKSNKNNSFEIEFIANSYSYLFIQAKKKNDNILNKTYSNKFTTEKIKENKYFNMFDNLKEICNELSERIKQKEISVSENNNNIIIIINLPVSKIKEIQFNLNEDKKVSREEILPKDIEKDQFNELNFKLKKVENLLYQKRFGMSLVSWFLYLPIFIMIVFVIYNSAFIPWIKKYINQNNDNLNNIILELKNENVQLKQEINDLKEKVVSLINYRNEKEMISNLNSFIINNNIEYNKLLKSWIDPNKKISAELLYRLSRDGEQISKFHELCDNKGPTLTLFYTEDGNKGGIYTPLSWDTNTNDWKNDMDSFMFNLNKNQKYKKKTTEYSILCRSDRGPSTPYFGFIEGEGRNMKRINHGGTFINEYYEKGSEILSNSSQEEKYFKVNEVEIYKITIIIIKN